MPLLLRTAGPFYKAGALDLMLLRQCTLAMERTRNIFCEDSVIQQNRTEEKSLSLGNMLSDSFHCDSFWLPHLWRGIPNRNRLLFRLHL